MEISPANTARAAVSRRNSAVFGVAIRLTVANDIVAMMAETATTSWRDGTKDGKSQQANRRGIEGGLGRHTGDLRVGHALRDQ